MIDSCITSLMGRDLEKRMLHGPWKMKEKIVLWMVGVTFLKFVEMT